MASLLVVNDRIKSGIKRENKFLDNDTVPGQGVVPPHGRPVLRGRLTLDSGGFPEKAAWARRHRPLIKAD
eukprot:scaffold65359_cov36-Phaeocystis_antarctica.AAC.1